MGIAEDHLAYEIHCLLTDIWHVGSEVCLLVHREDYAFLFEVLHPLRPLLFGGCTCNAKHFVQLVDGVLTWERLVP